MAELDRRVSSPTLPTDWNAAVLSVVDTSHVDGSALATGQILARIVVGEVPLAWTRSLSCVLLA